MKAKTTHRAAAHITDGKQLEEVRKTGPSIIFKMTAEAVVKAAWTLTAAVGLATSVAVTP